ncbi:MAG: TlpA disulfide reductase family protein [Pseudomonadota bacterium]
MHSLNRRGLSVRLTLFPLFLAALIAAGPVLADDSIGSKHEWTATGFDGAEIVYPAALDGKPTVLVFWATWCPYCRALMPYLGDIQNDYGGDKINILTVNVFEDGELDPAEHIAELGFPMIAVANGDPVAEQYSVQFTPGLMIVDGQGTLVWKRESTDLPPGQTVAEFWSKQVREQLDKLL